MSKKGNGAGRIGAYKNGEGPEDLLNALKDAERSIDSRPKAGKMKKCKNFLCNNYVNSDVNPEYGLFNCRRVWVNFKHCQQRDAFNRLKSGIKTRTLYARWRIEKQYAKKNVGQI